MTIDERLDRLSGIVNALAASVVHHDDQIGNLIQQVSTLAKVSESHEEEIARLRRSSANIERLLKAYLKRLPPQ